MRIRWVVLITPARRRAHCKRSPGEGCAHHHWKVETGCVWVGECGQMVLCISGRDRHVVGAVIVGPHLNALQQEGILIQTNFPGDRENPKQGLDRLPQVIQIIEDVGL